MRLGDHIGKGIWAAADKSLPVFYGVAFMFLVIRRLPAGEFGNYALVQAAYMVAAGLATTFAYTPLMRFIFEEGKRPGVKAAAACLHAGFVLVYLFLVVTLAAPLGDLLRSRAFASLVVYVPLLAAGSFLRIFAYELCRADLRVRSLFLITLVYFGSMAAGLALLLARGSLEGARDVLRVNLAGEVLASLLGAVLVRRDLFGAWRLSRAEVGRLLQVGKFSAGAGLVNLLYARMDVFLISSFLGPVTVATYASAQVFTRVYNLYRQLAGVLYSPVISRLRARKRMADIRDVFEKSVTFSLLLMLVPALLFLLGAPFLYGLFYGDRYPDGVGLLRLFGLVALVIPWQALSNFTVMLVGNPRHSFLARVTGFAAYMLLNLWWIPSIGAKGVILATFAAITLESLLLTRRVKGMIAFSGAGILSRVGDAWRFATGALVRRRS